MKRILHSAGSSLLILVVFTSALWLLHRELRDYHFSDFVASLRNIPPQHLITAIAITLAGYIVLIGYDWMALVYLGRRLEADKICLASLLGYSIGNSFGSLLGGSTVRYRLYSEWGLSGVEIFKLVVFLSVTLWAGVLMLGGVLFLVDPLPIPERLNLPLETARPLGGILLSIFAAYVVSCALIKRPLQVLHWDFNLPSCRMAFLQTIVASVDMLLAASVLYILLPPSIETSYWHFLAVYLLASVAALISHVPGGLGVLELVLLLLLSPDEPQHLIGALLAFRAIYFLLPLAIGLIGFGITEFLSRGDDPRRTAAAIGRWTTIIGPRLITISVFVAGIVLLFSGAMPPSEGRMTILRRLLPLPIIEVSHFVGSLIGMLLLLLARGLQRRIETAYYLTVTLLAAGIVVSLLKGFDFEEAIILAVMLSIMLPARRQFYRHGALLTDRFSGRWLLVTGLVLVATTWLMLMTHKHADYQHDLWWQFAFDRHVPRSLRAMAGTSIAVVLIGVARLLRSKSQIPDLPTESDLNLARRIVNDSPHVDSNLARLGDKRFLFNDEQNAFIMFGVEGQSWVVMGDPVGPPDASRELAWQFRELCDTGGWLPVFYQVSEDQLSLYVEMGLSVIKIGEEARVHLPDFTLEGHGKRNLRRSLKRLSEMGCDFSVIPQPEVRAILPELRKISDDWLGQKNAAEKGFSLGFFTEDYVADFPVAVIKVEGRITAFANIWVTAEKRELSVDLMRYDAHAPSGVMEYLFLQIVQ